MQVSIAGQMIKPVSAGVWRISRIAARELIALTALVALAAGLRFANLDALGYANHYQ
jgi:hypothetical protein